MQSNLYHILFLSCFFYSVLGFSQEKQSTIPAEKKDIAKDTTTVVLDSLQPKEVIEGVLVHNAEGYSMQHVKNRTLTLYDKAHVTYTDIDLKAGYIFINYQKGTLLAKGITDSLGYQQRPVFKQGYQESEQDSLLYNFRTKRALIYGVKTTQSGVITYSEKTKRVNDSTIYLRKLRFTTSKKENPDYYISTNKAKLVPGKKIIVGLSNLVLADVPTPVFLPFAYFPMSQKRTSGFIIPSWGDSSSYGFYLQNGGYYFAVNDYMDFTLLGDVYTNGRWGLQGESNYVVRYKYSGKLHASFENIVNSLKGFDDYSKSSNFNIRWSHSQDNKANPNARFAASVNLGSSKYYRESLNELNNSQFLTNTLSSSVSYYKNFLNSPFSLNLTATHSQNTNTEQITMTLPSLQLNMDRIYPFTGKGGLKTNAFQKIGFNYSMQSEYRINTTDSLFFKPAMFRTAKTGMQHNMSANTNMKAFKYFTLSPSLNYKDVWAFNRIQKAYDPTSEMLISNTMNGFNRFHEYNFGLSLSTNIYGTFNLKKGRLKAIRHTIRPTISYGYRPNFADQHNLKVQQSEDPTDLLTYSPFENNLYGQPSSGLSNAIGISVDNVLEAKVAPKDPDSDEEAKKITLLNNLNFSSSYNIAADSLQWQPVSVTAGTRFFKDKLTINMNATLDPYQIDNEGVQINKFNTGLLRLTRIGTTANFSLSSKDFDKKSTDKDSKGKTNASKSNNQEMPDLFGEKMNATNAFSQSLGGNSEDKDVKAKLYEAKIPWNITVAYAMNYSKSGLTSTTTNSLMFSGNLELSPKWKVGFSSGYDIQEQAFTFTRLNFSRDLDSWRLNFNWIPFGTNTSYTFFIGVKAAVLKDLKWDKRKQPDRLLF